MNTKRDCKYCDKRGLLWLPLRYCTVSTDEVETLKLLPDIVGKKIGQNVVDLKLSHSKYAVRLLRAGYLYVLIERSGIKYWDAYQVLEDAYLYKFNADSPPQITPKFSCDPGSCGVNASMVAIPEAKNVRNIWALFTHAPLTKAKLAEYKGNADAYSKEGKIQFFSPSAWLDGEIEQAHSLLPPELLKTVAEYVLFTQPGNPLESPLGKVLEEQLFPAINAAYAGSPPDEKGVYGGRLGTLQHAIKRNGYASLVLYDHIGLTQELNDFRNDAFKPIDDFLGRTEGAGPNNTRKFDIYHAITEWRGLMEKGLVTDAENSIERADILRRAEREPPFCDDTKEMRALKYTGSSGMVPVPGAHLKYPTRASWEAANSKIVDDFENQRENDEEIYLQFAASKGKKDWQNRYAPQLDLAEMERFMSRMNAISHNTQGAVARRSQQHLHWLKSARLLQAFDVCDQHDPISGEALSAQVFQCIFGMEGSPQAEGVLVDWATATGIKRENLLLRAFTRDQNGVKKEADKALTEVTEQVTGTTEYSVMPATSWHKAIKGLVSAVKSTDSALDEWMRNQGQSANYLNPKHIANVEARCFYFISTLTRSVVRKGVGGRLENAVVVRANALMASYLGDLALELEYKHLNNQIQPEKWKDLKAKHATAEMQAKAAAERKSSQQKRAYRKALRAKAELQNAAISLVVDAQLKAKLQIANAAKTLGWAELQTQLEASAEEHLGFKRTADELKSKPVPHGKVPAYPSPTNNYHQVRLGGVLAGIESLALLGKFHSLKEFGFNLASAEIFASACSLGSTLSDMMYAYTKSVRELPKYAAFDGVNKGGDIVRGGFKVTAGLLASIAGAITAWSDFAAIHKERDPFQRAILSARFLSGSASSVTGAIAAYSYSGPFLQHLASKKGRSPPSKRTLQTLSRYAIKISNRVTLLRIVAYLGWIGVAITVVDLAYAGYRWYVDYTAVTRWLSRCTFREVKTNKGFATQKEELSEFEKAQYPDQEEATAPSSTASNLSANKATAGVNP